MKLKLLLSLTVLLLCQVTWSLEPLPASIAPLQKAFYQASFTKFVGDLKKAHPDWNIPASIKPPVYNPGMDRMQWLDLFVETLANEMKIPSTKLSEVKSQMKDMHTSYSRNVPYARLPTLQVEDASFGQDGNAITRSVTKAKLESAYLPDHSLDMEAYVAERFPIEMQNFIRAKNITAYFHDSSCQDAAAFQKRDGFGRVIRYMGVRDNAKSTFFFAYNDKISKFRFVVCDLKGEDGRTRIIGLLGPVFFKTGANIVLHQSRTPLIAMNADGKALNVDPLRDRVVMGFQNTVWWKLFTSAEKDWQRYSLTDEGPDLSLFVNQRTGMKVLSVENVYGDEMTELLETLFSKGFRRFIYLGSTGGLDDHFSIGDVLLPSKFFDKDGKILTFENSGLKNPILIQQGSKVIRDTVQGWAPTLALETKAYLRSLQKNKVQALDVETLYFARFMSAHPSVTEHSIFLSVSDMPFGKMTYEQENATRKIPMKSIESIVPQLFVSTSENSSKRNVANDLLPRTKPPVWLGPDLFEKEY